MDITQANYLIDNELTADDRDFIRKANDGLAYDETTKDTYKRLEAMGLVQLLSLSHPRLDWGVQAVILTQDGGLVWAALEQNIEVQQGKEFITQSPVIYKPLQAGTDRPNWDKSVSEEAVEATVSKPKQDTANLETKSSKAAAKADKARVRDNAEKVKK